MPFMNERGRLVSFICSEMELESAVKNKEKDYARWRMKQIDTGIDITSLSVYWLRISWSSLAVLKPF